MVIIDRMIENSAKTTRVMMTGAGGFVAPYVAECLYRSIENVSLLTTVRDASEGLTHFGWVHDVEILDVTDGPATARLIERFQPTHVVHLAGVAAPTKAVADPDLAWRVNLGGTLNVARAILQKSRSTSLIFASSGLVYGDAAKAGRPLTETDLLCPNSDYAATKAAADLALGALAFQGLRVVRCRPFNHIGPGQTEDFALPNFAAQIARIERGEQAPILEVGNLDSERDFLDVRDVADAYVRCILRSGELPAGLILNIASGEPISIRSLLDKMLQHARVDIKVHIDPRRWRPDDIPRVIGDATAARRALGWKPQYDAAALTEALLNANRTGAR